MNAVSKETALEFCKLCNWAYECWSTHKQLFDSNRNRENTLGKARYFTSRLSIITQEYSLQQICKLHDPAIQQDKVNLTIDYICRFGDWAESSTNILTIQKNLSSLATKLNAARNKLLAHNDLETIMKNETLGEFPLGADEQYFKELQNLVNLVHEKWFECPYPFNDLAIADANEFIQLLKKA